VIFHFLKNPKMRIKNAIHAAWPWRKESDVIAVYYIKSCSHEVAKHKSGVPIPSDGTTSSHNIKEDGNAIRTNVYNF
jgi:hypothetical protein